MWYDLIICTYRCSYYDKCWQDRESDCGILWSMKHKPWCNDYRIWSNHSEIGMIASLFLSGLLPKFGSENLNFIIVRIWVESSQKIQVFILKKIIETWNFIFPVFVARSLLCSDLRDGKTSFFSHGLSLTPSSTSEATSFSFGGGGELWRGLIPLPFISLFLSCGSYVISNFVFVSVQSLLYSVKI